MAKDKNKMGSTPKNNAKTSDRRNKSEATNAGSPKPSAGSGSMNQSADRDRDADGRFTNESDLGSPKGGGSQHSQRIDADEEMDNRPGKSTGTPSSR
jgi:hypothetical protein